MDSAYYPMVCMKYGEALARTYECLRYFHLHCLFLFAIRIIMLFQIKLLKCKRIEPRLLDLVALL